MDEALSCVFASALPGFTKQEYSTISRALQLLKIAVATPDNENRITVKGASNAKLAISISCDKLYSIHEHQHQHVEFDFDSLEWKLKQPSSTSIFQSTSTSLSSQSSSSFSSSHSRSRSRSPFSESLQISRQDSTRPLSRDAATLGKTSCRSAKLPATKSAEPSQDSPQPPKAAYENVDTHSHEHNLDWTLQIPRSPHNQFLLDTAWERTSLGPMSQWSSSLRLMTLKMLRDPRPATCTGVPTVLPSTTNHSPSSLHLAIPP